MSTAPADLASDIARAVSEYRSAPPEVRPVVREAIVSATARRGLADAERVVESAIRAAEDAAMKRNAVPTVDPIALRGLAGDVVRTFAPSTEASPTAVLVQFLAAFGSAVGRTAYVAVGETRHYANEFALVVGSSARARKGDSKNVALRVMRQADPGWCVASGLSSGEGVVHHVRDEVRKADREGVDRVVDAGVADKRLLVVESEFASVLRVMGRDGNTLSPVLRAAWDADYVLGNLSKGAAERATGAHISLIAHATPADLAKYLTDTDTANGFANRFLIVLVERAQLLPDPLNVNPSLITSLGERTRHALDVAKRMQDLRRTPAANELWCALYPALSADRPGLFGDMLARAEAHVLRLSLVYALLDMAPSIDVPHLEAALAVWQLVEQSVHAIFAGRTGNRDADRIAEDIGPGEEQTRSEIRQKTFANHTTAARLDEAIALLARLPDWVLYPAPGEGRTAQVLRHLVPGESKPADAVLR